MNNLEIWDKVRKVPAEAKKPIEAGRLKGRTDINPVWRLKALTEQFGPCGIGWRYEITGKRTEKGAGDEVAAFVDINLYVRQGDEWSQAIPGTGGSMFVAKEKNGPYTSDECFKMALTDAISVSCKALGVGADVYWDKDPAKYNKPTPEQAAKTDANQNEMTLAAEDSKISTKQVKALVLMTAPNGKDQDPALKELMNKVIHEAGYQKADEIKSKDYEKIISAFQMQEPI